MLLIPIFLLSFTSLIFSQDCDNCGAPNCSVAPITDQLSVFANVDGFGMDLGCTPAEVRSVSDGNTVTFCASYTTPAVLEENFISFLASIPNSNAGCDPSNISNWTITDGCGAIAPAAFMTQEPNLPSFVQRPVWPVVANHTYELCYDVTVSGNCTQVSNPCIAPHWVPVICELQVNVANHDCSDNDGNFDVSIAFSGGGQGAGTYTLNSTLGVISGDDPNLVANGVIRIDNIPDGSAYSLSIQGNGVISGCDYTIASPGYNCASCPAITKATVREDGCDGTVVILEAEVDAGVEGVDYYIEWYQNGNPINQPGSSSTGLDGIYGNADDPATALTYNHTLVLNNGALPACSFEEQVFTAKLYCLTEEILDQGDINNQTTGGTIAASYVFGTETCVTLDLSTLPAGVIADHFQYQFRVTSGPPFGNSW
ncbi:MAG TPA: hypothetical protein ENK52_07125, partial [Saprospiraceae bacterium]|nr:hypothetical protein [Saprospiraceae bacterium]